MLLRPLAALLLLAGLGLPLTAASARCSDEKLAETVKLFKQHFDDTKRRTGVILRLGECDHPEAVELLVKLLGYRPRNQRALQAKRRATLLELEEMRVKIQKINARGGVSQSEATRINNEVAELSSRFARLGEELTANNFVRYAAIQALGKTRDTEALELVFRACKDSKWEVQAGALEALGLTGQAEARPHVRPHIGDRDPKVNISAIDAAALLADAQAISPIIAQLKAKSWQERMAAVGALGRLAKVESPLTAAVGPLVDALQGEDGRLQEDIDATLELITGYSFGGDPAAWKNWYAATKARLAEAIAERLAQREKQAKVEDIKGKTSVTFYGIETRSKNICFIVDTSGSMGQKAGAPRNRRPPLRTLTGGKDGKGDKDDKAKELVPEEDPASNDPNYPVDGTKMEVATYELIKVIKALPDDAKFNIVHFNTMVEVFSPKRMLTATDATKRKTVKWIEKTLKPEGGTNIFDALESAFQLAGEKLDKNLENGVDTIFFLTDGKPTHGRITETAKMLEDIAARNKLRKIKIHVIGVGNDMEIDTAFLKKLAESTGGIFVQRTGGRKR